MTDQAIMADKGLRRPKSASRLRSVPISGSRVWLVRIFVFSLLVPILIPAGPVLLMPHRLYLVAVFIPLLVMLFSRQAGRILWPDVLMIFSTIWACVALVVSAGVSTTIEPMGLFTVEFFGAYLAGRMLVRSGAEFRRLVWFLFAVCLVIVPFAVAEAVTHRAILLEMVPNSIGAVSAPERLGLRRAQAVFSHPILFGVFVSSCMGLFWYALRPGMPRIISYPIVGLGTMVSLSTGALISLVIQTGLVAWQAMFRKLKSRWKLFTVLTVFGYVTVDLLSDRTPFHLLVDYASFNSGSAYNRILIWQFGTQNVVDNPLFGLGMNVNNWVRPHWMNSSADNFWLLLPMQYGLPMILSLVLALVLILRALSKAQLLHEVDRNSRAGLLITLAGIIIAGGTVHYWHAMMAFVMFLFGAGLWVVQAEKDDGSGQDKDRADLQEPATSRATSQYTRFPQGSTTRAEHAETMSHQPSPFRRRTSESARMQNT